MALTAEERKILNVKTSRNNPVRLSYAKLFTPEENDQGKMQYSTMILIPKEDKETVAAITAAMKKAKELKWGGKNPSGLKISFRDGDKEGKGGLPEGTPLGSEPYAGHYFMNIKSDRKPGVVDQATNPIIDPNGVVSGDYARVSMNCYAWENKNGRGLSFGLVNVQLFRKGEPLDGRISAEDEFDAIEVEDTPEAADETGNDQDPTTMFDG